ncbi:GDP-4-dehydro-6-deoxy-D-mannose reductase [Actinoplanes tereljensis]|uniref:GDP-mannose 4,6-dehydratase n=1 Tax=Paractinoplanes tereljensis TaxID=571912 RepID=A0A919NUK4_9ACTN|nr:GDP-mannose 4,6-dehydratase [Actinoplanes tereljensis]GIF25435.1 GDP-mannose 4,6-dehydratase [Actinoplanes tereljensis]
MTALVTGATGFAGAHLMEALRQSGEAEAYGTSLSGSADGHIRQTDLTDYDAVVALLDELRPETIFHLAAFASPALSFKEPVVAVTSTLAMQINLFQACLALRIKPRIVVVSSGQIYGMSDAARLPLDESTPLDLPSPYAVAKVGQENLVSMYAKLGVESVIARPFNHIGPGQQPGYLVADLTKQIADLERDGGGVLRVGNLSSKRDFTDVRDVVRAYIQLAAKGTIGEVYNVCTGRSRSGQEILDLLLTASDAQIRTEPDPARMRPADVPDLRGDATKIRLDAGWVPEIPLEQTLSDTLAYWRSR